MYAMQSRGLRRSLSPHGVFEPPIQPSLSTAHDYLPGLTERILQPVDVHRRYGQGTAPPEDQQEPADFPLAHSFTRTGEMEQGKHRQRKLQGENDLAQIEQIVDAAVSTHADDEDGGDDRQRPRDHAAQPRGD